MATHVNTQQLLTAATQFEQTLAQIEQTIGQMDPMDQLTAMEQVVLQQQIELEQLQDKANTAFQRMQDFDPTSQGILDSLSKSDAIMEKLSNNQEFLLKFGSLFAEAQEVLQMNQSAKTQKLPGLQNRVVQLTQAHKDLNPKNAEAAFQFGLMLASSTLINQPNLSTQHAVSTQPTPTRRNDEPTRSQIIAQQDREYEQVLAQDQFKDLNTEFNELQRKFIGDPAQDFEKAIAYYNKLKTFSFDKAKYTFPNASQQIETLLKQAEDVLNLILQVQTTKETQPVQQTATSTQSALNPAFAELKDIITQLIQAQAHKNVTAVGKANQLIQPTFNKLNEDEKKTFLRAFNIVLKDAKKTTADLPETMLKQQLILWGMPNKANWDDKKKALEKVIGTSTQPAQATTIVASKALEMKQRIQNAMNAQPAVSTQQATARGPAIHPTHRQVRTNSSVIEEMPSEGQFPKSPMMTGIETLQSIFPLVQEDAQMSQLQDACQKLFLLDAEGIKCLFKISGKELNIADRPNFHLYFIHKNEASDKLKDDMQYGSKSWSGAIEGATNSERMRTIQRTIVEAALQGLEDAVNFDDGASVVQFLDILEAIKLDQKDRANDQACVAYNLFGAFYNQHVDARQNNSALIDPNASQFNGDFGRYGFRSSIQGIDPAVKLAAIKKVQDDLKAAWKV